MKRYFYYYFLTIILGASLAFTSSSQIMAEQTEQPSQEASPETKTETDESINTPVPELKPDLPKMAEPKPEKPRKPLKGGVQHSEVIKPNGSPQLGKLDGGVGKGKFKLKSNQLNSGISQSNETGLGIIGLKFAIYFGRAPVIYQVFPGTPAWDAGLKTRDNIIAVDGIPTFGLSKTEVYNMIVGKPGTQVTISYTHNHSFQTCTLTRMDVNAIPDPRVRRDYLSM